VTTFEHRFVKTYFKRSGKSMELEVCSVNGKDEDNLKTLEELFN